MQITEETVKQVITGLVGGETWSWLGFLFLEEGEPEELPVISGGR